MFSFRDEEGVLFSESTSHQSVFQMFNTLNYLTFFCIFSDFFRRLEAIQYRANSVPSAKSEGSILICDFF